MTSESSMTGDIIIAVGFLGGVLAYPVLQYAALRRLRDNWRGFARLPLIAMGATLLYTAAAFVAQSNLWPMLFIIVAPLLVAYLVALLLLHALLAGKDADH